MGATVRGGRTGPLGTTGPPEGGRMRCMTQPAPDEGLRQPSAGDTTAESPAAQTGIRDRVVVVTPEGMAVSGTTDEQPSPTELIEQPAKVMRIGSMIKQLLEEVRSAPLDEAGRVRLAQIHGRSIAELEQGRAPGLGEGVRRIARPVSADGSPSAPGLRLTPSH